VCHLSDESETGLAGGLHGHGAQLELELACFDLGNVQDLIDQPQQVMAAFLDSAQGLELALIDKSLSILGAKVK